MAARAPIRHRALTREWWRALLLGAGVAALLVAAPQGSVRAGERLPMGHQVALILKLLSYEHRLMAAHGDTIHLGILFDPGDDEACRSRDEFAAELGHHAGLTIRGHKLSLVPIAVPKFAPIQWTPEVAKLEVLYVAPGNGDRLDAIRRLTRVGKILSIGGEEEYAERGLAAAVVLRGERAGITINLRASREEGGDWDAQVLSLSRVIR